MVWLAVTSAGALAAVKEHSAAPRPIVPTSRAVNGSILPALTVAIAEAARSSAAIAAAGSVALAAGEAPGSGRGASNAGRGGRPPVPLAAPPAGTPQWQPPTRQAVMGAPTAQPLHLVPQLARHQQPPWQQQHNMLGQPAPSYEHFRQLQQLAEGRRQDQMQQQAQPPWLPAPLVTVPGFHTTPAAPPHLPTPLPPMPGPQAFGQWPAPVFGHPQAWSSQAAGPPPWQGGDPQGRGGPGRGSSQSSGGGRQGGHGPPSWPPPAQ